MSVSDRKTQSPIRVFFDGSCGVCAREIAHYRCFADPGIITFINIADPDFEARFYGPTREEFQTKLHVLDAGGQFHTGVDAFRTLWRALPGRVYPTLATLTGLPGVNALARCGYAVFARYRHLLPKRGTSTCSVPGTDNPPRKP